MLQNNHPKGRAELRTQKVLLMLNRSTFHYINSKVNNNHEITTIEIEGGEITLEGVAEWVCLHFENQDSQLTLVKLI